MNKLVSIPYIANELQNTLGQSPKDLLHSTPIELVFAPAKDSDEHSVS